MLMRKKNNKNMDKYIYIQKDTKGVHDPVEKMPDAFPQGTTYEDYILGKWILLTDEQVTFKELHPVASVKEIIDMRMTPLPPETTIEDRKKAAIDAVNLQAASKIEELFPLSVIRDIVFGRLSEEDMAQLQIDYNNTINVIGIALTGTCERIEAAADDEDAQDALAEFGDTVSSVNIDRRNVIDTLFDAGRDARIVRDVENRRTFN